MLVVILRAVWSSVVNFFFLINFYHLIDFFFFFLTDSGGGEKARKLHTSRGKLLPRERIDRLLDPG